MIPGLHRITSFGLVSCHLLVDDDGCTLIDTGFIGELGTIRRTLRKIGRAWTDINAVLLTHGHLDHAYHLSTIVQRSGATVYAHPEERLHVAGRYPYRGIARVCGALEAAGRFVLRYRAAEIDEPIDDAQVLPMWGGLEVIHLPGHTRGHCGFYSRRHDLLFIGDLVATWVDCPQRPPAFLNSCPELFAESFQRVAQLNPSRILCNHYLFADENRQSRRVMRYIHAKLAS